MIVVSPARSAVANRRESVEVLGDVFFFSYREDSSFSQVVDERQPVSLRSTCIVRMHHQRLLSSHLMYTSVQRTTTTESQNEEKRKKRRLTLSIMVRARPNDNAGEIFAAPSSNEDIRHLQSFARSSVHQ